MSDREALLSLATRCEALSGPDADVDKSIWLAFGKCLHLNTTYEAVQGDSGRTCDDCGADSWGNLGKHGQRLYDRAPCYTGSIDSAMSLVPAGMGAVLDSFARVRGACSSALWSETGGPWRGDAKTLPLALTAACLRALAQPTVPQP